jgi:2-amino-4-hydroxy-6-hydroxymethyldihydropteridine diphosphokinase
MPRVYLGLGSNLGDRLASLRDAVRHLRQIAGLDVVTASRLWESEPWEREPGRTQDEQRWYLNCVVAVDTSLPPRALLALLQEIERGLGRIRAPGTPEAQRFEPRPLDIDILLYGNEIISTPDDLHIPHLLLAERAFVLRPLAEVAPALSHPTLYRTMQELLDELVDDHEVRPGAYPAEWFEN